MVGSLALPELSLTKNPPVGYYFQVTFFAGGVIPNPLDIRFQKVSGITATVDTETLNEGGENLCTYHLPKGITYENLKLERGMVIGSPLNIEFNAAMSLFQFAPSNVMVSLLSEKSLPIANWLFLKAFPVKWAVSDLDATANAIVVDTMELAFTRFQILRI
ncbi:MAG: phage tail protein [Chloroflexi bacterium RBG_13_51_52]|nr:MAG: phage tail protein [Chloroflexi bacterium RBG_13_51_52]